MMINKANGLIFTLCLIVLSGVMNSVLFNIALVDMKEDLDVTAAMISWVLIIYPMMIALGSITYSKLASYFQLKTLLLIGVSLFVLGSVIGYASDQYVYVVIARIIQSAGGSSFIALSMIVANQYMTPSKKRLALTLLGGCLSLGSGLGLLISGVFTYLWGWHALFLLMIFVVVTLIGLLMVMPSGYAGGEKEREPLDMTGMLLLYLFIVSFILGVKLNGYLLILTVLSALYLIIHGRRKNMTPFIDLSVFRFFAFNRLVLISFVNSAAMVAVIFLFPLLAENMFHFTALGTGVILCVISIVAFLMSFVAKRFLPILGGPQLMTYAALMQGLGFLLLAVFGLIQFGVASIGVLAVYVGFTMMTVAINIEIPNTIEKGKNAMGLGVYNLINFLGMSFGPAIASRLLDTFGHFSYVFSFFVILLVLSITLSFIGVRASSLSRAG